MASLIESWLKMDHLPLFGEPPSSNTVPLAHPLDSVLGHPTTPIDESPTIHGSVRLTKQLRVKRFLQKLGALACVPSSTTIRSTIVHEVHQATSIRTHSPAVSTSTGSEVWTVEIFHDLQRFIMMFMEPIVTSSLHIYSSPLGLMPTKTELSCRYRQSGEDGLRVVRGCLEGWPQTLWTATKHSGGVNCVAVSLDGTTIVSGSSDNTLHLWEAKTGAAIGKAMEGHTKEITYIALSGEV
ncbi:hypothetical protein FRB93_013500 [Tulasnella sp. JGI-2019a]|nr:hypothetical protein FRB93_013500 [Tulasnella sp. JGI-2019a]